MTQSCEHSPSPPCEQLLATVKVVVLSDYLVVLSDGAVSVGCNTGVGGVNLTRSGCMGLPAPSRRVLYSL